MGDELQRMLVTMKQSVLERATPRPKRRRGHTGIVVGVVALLALGTASGAVALTLSHQDRPVAAPVQTQEPAPAPSATTRTSAPITGRPTPRPVPTASPTTAAVATIPTSCRATVPEEDYDRFFGDTPVQGSSSMGEGIAGSDSVAAGIAEPGADIYCVWRDPRADVSGLEMRIGPARSDAADLLRAGPTPCSEHDGGVLCRASIPADPYPVDRVTTWFVRGDTYVVIAQTNFPTNGLLDAVVGEIWGD
ncbi:hypothetical protein [Curtobacterium oceanosedimentum]|uniref:Uncharacterized protein n=1 Tax=Curtobacterium oceanosedimentum TaxID=465820 RepID=A0A147DLU4_9MICO|nr:hypothetical protein [Curtobacterium oceanosedimentum]KTR46307.1 hypothetical protein NS359_15695 [Curtobacterium oceanosedimentum]